MRNLWLLAPIAALVACAPLEDEIEPPSDRTSYPVEGIGLKEGNVLADLTFKAADGSEFSLDRDVFKDQKNRVMVFVTAANWCGACKEEAKSLADLHRDYADQGLIVVSAIFEDRKDKPATLDDVQWWMETYKTPYRVVLDDGFKLGAYYNKDLSPMNMVVDVDTMRIIKIMQGSNPQSVKALVEGKVGKR